MMGNTIHEASDSSSGPGFGADLGQQELAAIYAIAPIGLGLLSTDLRFVRLNQRLADLNHLSAAEHLGRSLSEVMPGLAEKLQPMLQNQSESRNSLQTVELYLESSDNWLEVQLYPLNGGFGLCLHDISDRIQCDVERQQAQGELRQKNAILDVINTATPTPIFVKDREGRIIYANPATLEVLGKSASEVIGYRDRDIYDSPELGAIVSENDQRIMATGQTEVVEESPDGIRTFLGTKVPYRNEAGAVIGLIGISNDISERVKMERALRHSEEQERAARTAAERANQLKDEFLAILSHEL